VEEGGRNESHNRSASERHSQERLERKARGGGETIGEVLLWTNRIIPMLRIGVRERRESPGETKRVGERGKRKNISSMLLSAGEG